MRFSIALKTAVVMIAITMLVGSMPVVPAAGQLPGSLRGSQHRIPENPMQRAGNPMCVAPWARVFPDSKYKGYHVGGGAALYGSPASAFRGDCRYVNEGTYGVDYAPWYSRVSTQWFHGRKQQGGEGQYEPDGRNNPLDDHLGFGPFKPAPRLFNH